MSDSENSRRAIRTAFWSWTVTIAVGLVVMIVLPLTGR